jgi:hypothetical protein
MMPFGVPISDRSLIYVDYTIHPLSTRRGGHKQEWKRDNRLPHHHLITDLNNWFIESYMYNAQVATTKNS